MSPPLEVFLTYYNNTIKKIFQYKMKNPVFRQLLSPIPHYLCHQLKGGGMEIFYFVKAIKIKSLMENTRYDRIKSRSQEDFKWDRHYK